MLPERMCGGFPNSIANVLWCGYKQMSKTGIDMRYFWDMLFDRQRHWRFKSCKLGSACYCKKLGRRSRWFVPVSCTLMALPCQASKPQGHKAAKFNVLVDNVSGTGQGWQQSRSNWTLLAVAGYWARVHVAKQLATTSLLYAFLFSVCTMSWLSPVGCSTELQIDGIWDRCWSLGPDHCPVLIYY